MRRYDLAVFDFDGTLADSFPWFLETIDDCARDLGFRSVDRTRLQTYRGMTSRELMAALQIPWWRLPAVTTKMRRAMHERGGSVALFDGIGAALREVAASGVRLALVTSNSKVNAGRILGPELFALFEHLGCDVPIFGKKRATAQALKKSGVPKARAVSIGDEIRDADAASAVGIAFAGVTWGFATEAVLAPRTSLPLLRNPTEISRLLLDDPAE